MGEALLLTAVPTASAQKKQRTFGRLATNPPRAWKKPDLTLILRVFGGGVEDSTTCLTAQEGFLNREANGFFCLFLGISYRDDRAYMDVHVRALHGPQIRCEFSPGQNIEAPEAFERFAPRIGSNTLVFCVIPSGFHPQKHWKKFEKFVEFARAKNARVVLILQDARDIPKAKRRRLEAFVVEGNVAWRKQEAAKFVDGYCGRSVSSSEDDAEEDQF